MNRPASLQPPLPLFPSGKKHARPRIHACPCAAKNPPRPHPPTFPSPLHPTPPPSAPVLTPHSTPTSIPPHPLQTPPPTHLLSLHHLGYDTPSRPLFRELSLHLAPGTFLALVGLSGAGKTTLLHLLAGIRKPTHGHVTYYCPNCHHPLSPSLFRKHIAIIFQNLHLTPNSSLLTNALCGRLPHLPWWRTLLGFPRHDKLLAFRLLADLGLAHQSLLPAHLASGGEKQRTALARALLQQPLLLLADEPVSQLDTYHAGRALGILHQATRQSNLTVICSLHNPDHVARFADYVLSLDPSAPNGWHLRKNSPSFAP